MHTLHRSLLLLALSAGLALSLASCGTPTDRRPLIGISCSHPTNASMVSMNYSESVILAGGRPILLPVTGDSLILSSLLDLLDGLILSGGGDLNPAYYGEEPVEEAGEPDSLRDVYDMLLIGMAAERRLPMLGICRGEQLINVYFGGSLYQDLPTQYPDTTIRHNQDEPSSVATHTVNVLPGSFLHQATGRTTLQTNTHHHQAVRRLGSGLRATAWAADSLVEAFESADGRPIYAVQFHPEALTAAGDEVAARIIKSFVEKAGK